MALWEYVTTSQPLLLKKVTHQAKELAQMVRCWTRSPIDFYFLFFRKQKGGIYDHLLFTPTLPHGPGL